jgi:pimeloyl-ACP methyl ester carboxylesterase
MTAPAEDAERLEVPSGWRLLNELRGVGELPRLLLRAPELARQPRGDGQPVLVFPGFGAGDASTLLLRAYLSYLGYAVRGWGLGPNRGDVPALVPQVTALVRRRAERSGHAVRLVGWSLGGVLAREAAREAPDAVDRVVTLGSPVVGGPKYTTAGASYARRGFDLDEIEAAVAARERESPLCRPVTAIYSRNDGVVAWRACIDRLNAGVEHVEVAASHVGLGVSPDVYRILAERLAP